MSERFQKTKPSFLEAGLPCASLSAECQADNDARQRPPQNRLHIWWARRPPTICRVAVLSGLLPYDADLSTKSTNAFDPPVQEDDLDFLTGKEREHLDFYRGLVKRIPPSDVPGEHRQLLLALRVFGDPARFDAHRLEAKKKGVGTAQGVQQISIKPSGSICAAGSDLSICARSGKNHLPWPMMKLPSCSIAWQVEGPFLLRECVMV